MAKKQLKSKKQSKKRKTIRKRKQRGGGCGCNKKTMYGGGSGEYPHSYNPQASFTTLPLRSFYELNSYANDPTHTATFDRNTPMPMKGGSKRTTRKMRGGAVGMSSSQLVNNLPFSTYGAATGGNTLRGLTNENIGVHAQNVDRAPVV